jgi:acyl-CoA synthetase (NDP forming)
LADLVEAIPHHFPEVRRILLYLETVPEATRLRRAIEVLPGHMRVLALRGGTTTVGVRAVAGHTGALAAEPALAAALLEGVGIERVGSLTEALDAVEVLDRLGSPQGRRAGVITNAGGPGVLAADALAREGFALPVFSPALQSALRAMLPPAAVVENPVDMLATANPASFETCLARVAESQEIDVVVPVFMHPVTVDAGDIARALDRGLGPMRERGVVCWLASAEADHALAALRARGIAAIGDPDRVARALRLWRDRPLRERPTWPEPRPRPKGASRAGGAVIPDIRLQGGVWGDPAVLEAPRHRLPPQTRVVGSDSIPAAAAALGYPLMIKVESGTSPHKTTAGLLEEVHQEKDLGPALHRLESIAPADARWLLQRRVPPGPEIYVGFLRHPRLGSFVGFAPGGRGVEGGNEATWISIPATTERAMATLRGSSAAMLLGGSKGAGMEVLTSLVGTFARLEDAAHHVVMAEVNPAIWDGELLWLVDCRWSPG